MTDSSDNKSIDTSKERNVKTLSVKTNYFFNLVVQLLTYLFPLITAPYLSRVLTPDGIGQNSFVNSVVSYFTLIVAFGYTAYGTSKISKQKSDKSEYSKTFWEIFFSRVILFAASTAVYLLMAYFWGFGRPEDKLLFFAYSLMLVFNVIDISYLFQGLENFRIISIANVCTKIVSTVAIFVFVKSSSDLLIYVLIYCSQSILSAVVLWIIAFKSILNPHFSQLHVWNCLKESFFYFLPTVAISVYTILDKTMLGALTSNSEVGYYEEAYKIIGLVAALINAITPIMLSHISALVKEGKEDEIKRKIEQMSELYALLVWPCLTGIYATARYFFPAFFGEAYIPTVAVSYVLAPLIFIVPISGYVNYSYYTPRGKVNQTTLFYLTGALINFGANFIAIPRLGARGAALTTVIAEGVISTLFVIFSRKSIDYKRAIITGIKPLLASLVMLGSLMLMNYLVLDAYFDSVLIKTLISIPTGMLIYALSLLALREKMVMQSLSRIAKLLKRKTTKEGS